MEVNDSKNTITLFCGGDVNLGRRQNYLSKIRKAFVDIDEMTAADCRMINLECVIGTQGSQTAVKHYFYLRARPEQANILTQYNIDIVTTANNHACDYGTEAMLEQITYLDTAGILHTGTGKNFEEAIKPAYKKVGDITLAILSFDSCRRSAAATADKAGTAYFRLSELKVWKSLLEDKIRQAHEKADVVILCPHWGKNLIVRPLEIVKRLGRIFIDMGADVVLGCHAHYYQGVENYKNRPIIYDMGDFLFDTRGSRPLASFILEISKNGVEKVNFIPLQKFQGQTQRAKGEFAETVGKNFIKLCNEFETETKLLNEGVVEINFQPPPRESKIKNNFIEDVKIERRLIEPLTEPRPEWTAEKVPDDAIIQPQNLGPLKLIGYRIPPLCRNMTQRRMLYVETYWTIDEPVDKNYLLLIRGVPVKKCSMQPFGRVQYHEFCDFMWPVTRWKPGVIYRERFGLLPPRDEKKQLNVDLRVEVRVIFNNELVSKFTDPEPIKMQIEGLPYV